MGQTRKKTRKGYTSSTKTKGSKNDPSSILKKLDNLQTTVKQEHKEIPTNQNKNKQLIGAILIIVVGMSGVILLGSLNSNDTIIQNDDGQNSDKQELVSTIGGFTTDNLGTIKIIGGKVSVVYASAEFCPYCAGEKWALAMALSQFGALTGLSSIITPADEGSVPSYSFVGASYTSTNVNFQPVELQDSDGKTLQTPNSLQKELLDKYDPQGSVPFMCICGTTFKIGKGASIVISDFSGKSFEYVKAQVDAKSGALYDQIKIESDYIVSIINQCLTKLSTTTQSQPF